MARYDPEQCCDKMGLERGSPAWVIGELNERGTWVDDCKLTIGST